jgi:hypothetical protein
VISTLVQPTHTTYKFDRRPREISANFLLDALVKTEISVISGHENMKSTHFTDQAIQNASLTAAAVTPTAVLITFFTIIIT